MPQTVDTGASISTSILDGIHVLDGGLASELEYLGARIDGPLWSAHVLEEAPEKIELVLMELVPQEEWTLFSHLLIWHGRRRCYARNPDCSNCEVRDLCPKIGVRRN